MKCIRAALLMAGLLVAAACDMANLALLDSLPLDGTQKGPVHIYLGVDGLAFDVLQEMRRDGAFQDARWQAAPLVAMFPATSDASWPRILQTGGQRGYEVAYYDAAQDTTVNNGFACSMHHMVPPAEGVGIDAPTYMKAFDYDANGYLDQAEKYSDAASSLADSLDSLFYIIGGRMRTQSVLTAWLGEVDVMGHIDSRADYKAALMILEARLMAFKRNHRERDIVFTLFSDHGMDFTPAHDGELVDFRDELAKVGVRSVDSFGEGAAAAGPFAVAILCGRVSYVALHTAAVWRQEVARRVASSPTVDLVVAASQDATQPQWQWVDLWRAGQRAAHVGYDPQANLYWLDPAEYTKYYLKLINSIQVLRNNKR